jgi:small-conductance mechanosensitive channel
LAFQVDIKRGALLQELTVRNIFGAVVIVAVGLLIIRYLSRMTEALSVRTPGARFILKWFEQVMRLIVTFATAFAALLVLAPSSDAFLAALGSAAIAIALGAQDLVRNILGGLVILTDRPYQLGDRITVGDTTGEVVHIGLRSTKVRTAEDARVTVPNSDLLSGQVSNSNHGVPECQVVTTIYAPSSTDPAWLIQLGYEAAWCCGYLRTPRPVNVVLTDEYSETPFMRLQIKAYVIDHRYVRMMQTDITSRVKRELAKAGVLANWNPS